MSIVLTLKLNLTMDFYLLIRCGLELLRIYRRFVEDFHFLLPVFDIHFERNCCYCRLICLVNVYCYFQDHICTCLIARRFQKRGISNFSNLICFPEYVRSFYFHMSLFQLFPICPFFDEYLIKQNYFHLWINWF